MQKTQNLQEGFLNRARTERVGVTVFLVNGFQMRGTIRGFDSFVVLLESEGKQQVIYKHAISTIVPAKNLNLAEAYIVWSVEGGVWSLKCLLTQTI